jgi:hypothetical protein
MEVPGTQPGITGAGLDRKPQKLDRWFLAQWVVLLTLEGNYLLSSVPGLEEGTFLVPHRPTILSIRTLSKQLRHSRLISQAIP